MPNERLPDCAIAVLHLSDGTWRCDAEAGKEYLRLSGGRPEPWPWPVVRDVSGGKHRGWFDGGGDGAGIPAGDVGVVVGRLGGDRDVFAVAVSGAEAVDDREGGWRFDAAGFS